MKLSDIRSLKEAKQSFSKTIKDFDLWAGRDSAINLEDSDVEVEYDYEAPSRDERGSVIIVKSVVLKKNAKVYDEDGSKVMNTLPSGTELLTQKWWKPEWTEWIENEIAEDRAGDDDGNPDDDWDDSTY